MNRIAATWRNGCFGGKDDHLVFTIPKWMFSLRLWFKSSLLLNGSCGIQVLYVSQSTATAFAFSSVFSFFYSHVGIVFFYSSRASWEHSDFNRQPFGGLIWVIILTRKALCQNASIDSPVRPFAMGKFVIYSRSKKRCALQPGQCCGSKYIEFGSGSRILAQFESILKEKKKKKYREKPYL